MKKYRLDGILIEQKFVKDKNDAFVVVTEGRVLVNGQKAVSPAQPIDPKSKIEIKKPKEYVGRGAYKLEEALNKFKIDVSGKICADIGSATGGFTEVLLRHGAKKVYAIDTAKGKLDLSLRDNPRVVVMEETDIRDIKNFPEKIDIFTIDVSLIPLHNILLALKNLGNKNAGIVALFKPQYEVGDKFLKHGIVRDEIIRERAFRDFLFWARKNNFTVKENIESPIKGSAGNTEYLTYLKIR